MAAKKKAKKKAPTKSKSKKARRAPARKAKKTASKASKRPAKKAKKAGAAKKTGASARAGATKKAKAAARKAPARKASKKTAKKKQIKGEGDYAASRAFLKDQSGFVEKNKSDIPAMGRQAERALDGPEGEDLRAAEAEAASRSRDTF